MLRATMMILLQQSSSILMLMHQPAAGSRILALFCWIWYLICQIDVFALQQFNAGIDRHGFLSNVGVFGGLLLPWLNDEKQLEQDWASLVIPLRFLPVGGCWAMKIFAASDEQDEKYYAVVDTGSPFLTAPASLLSSIAQSTSYSMTKEQYGQTISEMNWKKIPYITILTNSSVLDTENFVVGIENTLQEPSAESESVFAGLVNVDDSRPSFLQQLPLKTSGFRMSFSQNYLMLSQRSLIDKQDPEALPLVDLRPYGPDLYHYALDCESLKIRWNDGLTENILASDLKRPVWLVLDTGLTGCVFSDSLLAELQNRRRCKEDVVPAGIAVSTISQGHHPLVLESSDQYWVFSSFRLPWFADEQRHPHIIALGCTFWTLCDSLTIDVTNRNAKITPRKLKS